MSALDPGAESFPLSDEQRMLLRMRDILYEGSWDDFERDLRARAEGRPHVFETVLTSPEMLATIGSHLAMIDSMRMWETKQGVVLSAEAAGTM
jgi:hypothetical protein